MIDACLLYFNSDRDIPIADPVGTFWYQYARGRQSSTLSFFGNTLCVPRTSSGMLKVKSGNIGDEGRQERVVL